jgi:hypothetical protein
MEGYEPTKIFWLNYRGAGQYLKYPVAGIDIKLACFPIIAIRQVSETSLSLLLQFAQKLLQITNKPDETGIIVFTFDLGQLLLRVRDRSPRQDITISI